MRDERYIQLEAFEFSSETPFGEFESGFEVGEFGEFEAFDLEAPVAWEQGSGSSNHPRGASSPSPRAATCPPQVTNVDCPPPGTSPDLVLDNFVFDNSNVVSARHSAPLETLARKVIASIGSAAPVESILIAGHTDPAGSDDYNFALGWRRARAILAEFCRTLERLKPGVTARIRFELTSCGERQPKSTPELSRRVEIFLRRKAVRRPPGVRPRPPVQPPCRFCASVHGFKFPNSFSLPAALTGPLSRIGIPIGSGAYGLCGGMSFLAADHFVFGVPIPTTTSIPTTGSSLYNQILRRQLDSLALTSISLGFGAPVLKFHKWMGLPDRGPGSTATLTLAEFRGATAALRRGRPVVFGLVLAKYPGGSLTNNHQIVAHCVRTIGPNRFQIDIYDPNFPLNDTVKIEVSVVGGEALSTHVTPSGRSPIRGFFVMSYTPVRPLGGTAREQTVLKRKGTQEVMIQAAEPFEAYTDFELEFEINRSSRDYIKWVQSSLNRIIGARLVVDGISGSKTRAAVQTFQRQKGLTADGIVGPITERALIAAGAGQPPGGAGGAPSSGTPGTGSPASAIDTFLPYSGPGYESKYTSSDLRFNQYGRSEAILALQWIAREWQRKHPNGPKLYLGPISKKGGGTLCYSDGVCHAEHKDGLDIDIRPVRNDQSKGGLTFTDASYSRQLTQEFVDLAWSNRCVPVEKILFNDPAINRVNYSSGHDDHLHVSFKAPSGSLPAECRSTSSGYGWELSEELEQDWEEFLDDFRGSFTKSRIGDRTAFTPKDRRKGVRDIKKVHALVLHQMAFSRGNEPKRYDTVTAHFAILPNGKITQLHPETSLLWASNGFNACSVAVEFAGNFPNTKGKCWEAKKFGCHKLTPEQIEAGRYLVEYLIKKIGLTHILAHRQAIDSRENCPGPDIWYNVGQWAVEKHGLNDGGPGFKVGSGHPIPDAWRT